MTDYFADDLKMWILVSYRKGRHRTESRNKIAVKT